MTVTLCPITKENWRYVYQLSETLSEEQRNFVSDNGFSMLEAIWDAEKFTARAIYADDVPVGFLMTGYEPERQRHWIVRFMIGADHQRKGYGRAAMQLVIDEYKAKPGCAELYIGFAPENHVARALYSSFGFLDTGRTEYEECVYCLPLRETSVSEQTNG